MKNLLIFIKRWKPGVDPRLFYTYTCNVFNRGDISFLAFYKKLDERVS